MARRSAGKAYRDQQRERLIRLGVRGRPLIEQLVTDLMRCGCRPREAWRLAHELTEDEIAARFDRIRGDPNIRMRGSRICEYEKWPTGGIRPSVRTLKILAAVYKTSWDRLVDVDDLEKMPACDRQAFLDISELCHGDSLDVHLPLQRGHYPAEQSTAARERLPIPSSPSPSERSAGALLGEVTHFTGRDGPMAELRAHIAEHGTRGTVVSIYAIDGMAGVGKTAFARHAAQEFATSYPDGAIWVDLYGHTPGVQPREPAGALEQMLLQLGLAPEAIRPDQAERQDQWRRLIHAQRRLIVMDNALTSDQVLPLLPEAPGCLVLITSRRKLTSLTDAYPLSLDVLGWDEAERLFINLVGAHRCENRDAVRQILAACGRLPLAIRLIAGRLRHYRGELLADVAADFADQTASLDAFVAEHLSVRAAFEWSYRRLTDEQRRTFRLLSWHPGPAITPVVIAAVANVSPGQGRPLLRELVDHNLLEQLSVAVAPGGPRYRMHDLVRLYARECADAEEPATEQAAAVTRLAASYLAITREADRLLRPYISGDHGKSTTADPMLAFADASQARTWLAVERHNLLGCVRAMPPTTEGADLAIVLAVHFRDFGFWSDVRHLYSLALTVYRNLGERRGEVDALWGLGYVERLVGEYVQSREYHIQALTLARDLDYRCAEVDALGGLGQVERLVGEYAGLASTMPRRWPWPGLSNTDSVKRTRCVDWARLSGSSGSTCRPVSTTPRRWPWPGSWATSVLKPTRYGVWVRSSSSSVSTSRPGRITPRGWPWPGTSVTSSERSWPCGSWARWNGVPVSMSRLASATPRRWPWPGSSVTGAMKVRRCGGWVRLSSSSGSTSRLGSTTPRRWRWPGSSVTGAPKRRHWRSWATASGWSGSMARPGSTTPRRWRWPGSSVTGSVRCWRCGDWARLSGWSGSMARPGSTTPRR